MAPGSRLAAAPRALGGRLRRLGARTPLRVRLVATVLLLVVAALVGSGFAATATLRAYLVGRVDDQLSAVAERPGDDLLGTDSDGDGRGGDRGGRGGGRDRLVSEFVSEVTDAAGKPLYGGPSSNLISGSEPLPRLPVVTAAQSRAAGTRLLTVPAVSGDASWRVRVQPVTLSDGTSGTLLVAQSLGDVDSTVSRLLDLLLIIGAAAVLVIAGVGYVVVRASLRPLRAVERTAADIAAGDLTHRVPAADPRTEVGRLAGALNTMLGEIETAFAARAASERTAQASSERARRSEERMRRFVADASHELRTPLTTIRGFAELYRQGAVSDPEQLPRVMRRIEDEAVRMGLLVDDLLMLARLDAERPLAREPVDLLTLADDAVHSARATSPQRRIRLEVGVTDPPPIVTGDATRLRQVLGNLLTNALRHTPDGTAVTVGVGTVTSRHTGRPAVALTVADDGPGLTPEAAERVFERFYRADAARTRDDGGSGLGLAIVAALVAGHDGHVDVETAPGTGACFRVELPLAEQPAEQPVEQPPPGSLGS